MTQTPQPPAKHRLPMKALIAVSAGNAVEWFDWTIFTLFSTYFATQFFPPDQPTLAFIFTFTTFAISFFFRPLGGWLIGRLADRRGRKPALMFTIGLMSAGAVVIAISPTFEVIGWAAPMLLLLARIAQGISAGGEIGNSYAYIYELAPRTHKGRYASFVYISSGIATLAGSLFGFVMSSSFSREFMEAWGWRIPFVVGGLLSLVVLWLRRSVSESAEFSETVATSEPVKRPLWTTLRFYPKSVLQIVGSVSAITLLYYTLTGALKVYASTPLDAGGLIGASESDTFLALTIATTVFVLLQYPFGALADKIGRRNQVMICVGLFAVLIVPLSGLLSPNLGSLILVFVFGLALFAAALSVAPAVWSDLMPADLRGVGVGAWYNVSVAMFGGTAPLVLTLLSTAKMPSVFFWYIAVMAVIGVIVLFTIPDERKVMTADIRRHDTVPIATTKASANR